MIFTDLVLFSEKEMDDFANRFLYLINPNFVKVIVSENNDVVSFIIAMSDISKGIQKSKGFLIPFGIFHVLRAGRKSEQLNILLSAIDPNYRGRSLDVIMGIKLLESAKIEEKQQLILILNLNIIQMLGQKWRKLEDKYINVSEFIRRICKGNG